MNQGTQIRISPTTFGLILTAAVALVAIVFRQELIQSARRPDLVISELLAVNRGSIVDGDGGHEPWIEIHNARPEVRSLAGWSLTDDFRLPRKWVFPAVEIAPGGFLVVFASGKNRTNDPANLHTNFRLSPKGEYLALIRPDGRTVEHEYLPKYPPLDPDLSFGLRATEFDRSGSRRGGSELRRHAWFVDTTPGRTNADEMLGRVADTQFSVRRGLFREPFEVTITTATPDAVIRYTTNSALPTAVTGRIYEGPIPIRGTTVLRAAAFKPGFKPAEVDTQTYLFPAEVVEQVGTGFPETWGEREGAPVQADYAMDPEITRDARYRDRIEPALRALPSLSLVLSPRDLLDPDAGIYTHPLETGPAWERPASLELLQPDGSRTIHVLGALRIQGGWSRRPEESPKHSFRLEVPDRSDAHRLFRTLFGTVGTRGLDSLVLRAGCNNSWLHWNAEERRRGDLLRDEFMRESFRELGGLGARGRFVHLYLNGLYWGIYNACERPDASFLAAHLGGKPVQYESRNAGNVLSGDEQVWNQIFALANAGLDDPDRYAEISRLVDLDDFCAFMLVQIYGGTSDWDAASNWYAGRRSQPPGRYRFLIWDSERSLEGVDANILEADDDRSPTRLFQSLRKNSEFRTHFARLARGPLGEGGVLSPAATRARYARLAGQLRAAIVAESARWGDYRRDVHTYREGPYELYTVDDHWEPEVKRLLDDYFPRRTAEVIRQLGEAGLY
jgi:hypothetical protein